MIRIKSNNHERKIILEELLKKLHSDYFFKYCIQLIHLNLKYIFTSCYPEINSKFTEPEKYQYIIN